MREKKKNISKPESDHKYTYKRNKCISCKKSYRALYCDGRRHIWRCKQCLDLMERRGLGVFGAHINVRRRK